MSISSYASDSSAASSPHSYDFSLSDSSRQSGMVQPVVNEMLASAFFLRFFFNEMLATVHAAGSGSSLLGLFTSFMYNLRFDSLAPGGTNILVPNIVAIDY
eukprot:scaffold7913_cov101-Isochrysis_galbana.AAC.1